MAKIFVKVPNHWPDLKVTSYIRDTGSHSGGAAIDLAFSPSDLNRAPGGNFWFYYYQTANLLWGAQRSGVVNIARPPDCPHFHCELSQKLHRMGLEDTRYINGDCVYIGMLAKFDMPKLSQVTAQTFADSAAFMRKVHAAGGEYVSSFENHLRALALTLEKPEKYISVNANGKINETDLQNRLIVQFGDDSTAQAVADNVSHMIGYTSAQDAKENLLTDLLSHPLVIAGGLSLAAYWAYQAAKERRYWQLTTTNQKPQ